MKREGRQHGMVRTLPILPSPLNPRPNTRYVNRFDAPATAGLFTRVSSKPTNHSKFTGKCGQPRCNGCHLHPTRKAKDKTKGNHKLKSSDVVSNHKLLAFHGVSATRVLDQLSNYLANDDDHDDYEVSDCDVYDNYDGPHLYDNYDGPYGASDDNLALDSQSVQTTVEIIGNSSDDQNQNGDDQNQNGDEEGMSFCDVGFVVDLVEGDDWCLVGEM
ncbi:hypothetical protein L484_017678 [Morus notabilis]|uniref:Uncharacterized protein n=1 Tax=Morus notabilis TaxID=981085 RepID=W9SWX5_9ROSA|nr:uncharacterized protein LOC21400666 [Morus notabilis]EXC31396.1 hypothetical protein L484_017678 [Morus notabilis]